MCTLHNRVGDGLWVRGFAGGKPWLAGGLERARTSTICAHAHAGHALRTRPCLGLLESAGLVRGNSLPADTGH